MIAWLLDLLFGAYDPLDLESFPRGEGRLHDLTEAAHDERGPARWPLRSAFWLRDDPAALEHPWLSPVRVLRPELPLGIIQTKSLPNGENSCARKPSQF